MIKVYIASPYSKGDQAANVKAQMDIADKLINIGFCPIVPLYFHFQHMYHPKSYDKWSELGIELLKSCDCLLRLTGESKGADREVDFAMKNFIPVFYNLKNLKKWAKRQQKLEEQDCIDDGFGNIFSSWCSVCGKKTMEIVRPGKVQCSKCG